MLTKENQKELLRHVTMEREKEIREFFAKHEPIRGDLDFKDEEGTYVIVPVIASKNLNILELFLQHEVNVNLINESGKDAWFYAIRVPENEEDAFKITEMLFEYRTPDNHRAFTHPGIVKTLTYKPLHECALFGYTKVAKLYVEKIEVDVNERDNILGRTALHWATNGKHLDFIKFLLERGADPFCETFEPEQLTPLQWAEKDCFSKTSEIIPFLKLEKAYHDYNTSGLPPPKEKINPKHVTAYCGWRLSFDNDCHFLADFVKNFIKNDGSCNDLEPIGGVQVIEE